MNKSLIILFLILLTGCGNVLDKNANIDNCISDLTKIRNSNKELYVKQDIDQCYTLILLCKLGGIKDINVTYRKLLDSIRANRIKGNIKLKNKKH